MRDGAAAHDCRVNGHTERIHDGRHAEMALNEVRNLVADMEGITGARTWAGWLRDAMKRGPEHCLLCATEQKTEPASDPAATEAAIARVRSLAALWAKRTDQLKRASQLVTAALNDEPLALAGLATPGPAATQATEPHTGLVVQPYRNDRGENVWVFRCWGTDDGCDGWLSLDHYSEQSAERARDRHAAEEHGAPGPAATEEQDLVHALGGDRTAQTIARTLTVHGHTLNAVRTMTYAELLAVPGIGGPSLARIRAALDGVPEPDAAAATRPSESAIARVRVLHRRNENTGECEYCSFRDYPTYAVPYPCDTVRALDGEEQPS